MKKGLRVFSAAFIAAMATFGLASCKKDGSTSTPIQDNTNSGGNTNSGNSNSGNSNSNSASGSDITPVEDVLNSISISTNPTKVSYKVGETFSADGMVVKGMYSVSGEKTITEGYTGKLTSSDNQEVTGAFSAAGTYTYTVTYEGKTAEVSITVTEAEVVLEEISLNTTDAKLSFEVGQTYSAEGLSVIGRYSNGRRQAVTNYTTKVYNSSDEEVTGAFTASGTYKVVVTVGEFTKDYNITVTKQQVKQSIHHTFEDITADDTKNGHKYLDTEFATVTQVNDSGTESDNVQEIDGVNYNKVVQVKSTSNYYLKVTSKYDATLVIYGYAKKQGQALTLIDLATENADEAQTGAQVAEVVSPALAYRTEFHLTAGHEYTLSNASTGGNYCIYFMDFNYSFDADTVSANAKMEISVDDTEFDLTGDGVFNLTNPQTLKVTSFDNKGFSTILERSAYDVKVTAKDSTDPITEITAAGVYTVTVSIKGTELSKSYDITVTDPTAVITAVRVTDGTEVNKVYYEGKDLTLSLGNSTVTFTKGGLDVTAEASEYTLSLVNSEHTAVDNFTTAGTYFIKVTANGTEVSTYFEINYETVSGAEYDKSAAKTTVVIGAETYNSNVTVVKVWTNTANKESAYKEDVTSSMVVELFSDEACTEANKFADVTTAFATEGTVYAKFSVAGLDTTDTLAITVANNVAINWVLDCSTFTTPNDNSASETKQDCTAEELGNFTAIGKITKRSKTIKYENDNKLFTSECMALETAKNGGLTFTVDTQVTVTLSLTSTSESNKSLFKMVKGDTVIAATNAGTYSKATDTEKLIITGKAQEITYVLEAGTYSMIFESDSTYNRGGRFIKVVVSNQ